jgi:hypothetical protein
MEVKIIIIIISLIIVVGIMLTALNKKHIKNALGTKLGSKSCSNVDDSKIQGYDTGGNQAMIQEEYQNVRRENGRENSYPDPNATKRSDICTTGACKNCDPYNTQLMILCKQCNN